MEKMFCCGPRKNNGEVNRKKRRTNDYGQQRSDSQESLSLIENNRDTGRSSVESGKYSIGRGTDSSSIAGMISYTLDAANNDGRGKGKQIGDNDMESNSYIKGKIFITDAGNRIELTNPPQGPYLNRDFEERLFGQGSNQVDNSPLGKESQNCQVESPGSEPCLGKSESEVLWESFFGSSGFSRPRDSSSTKRPDIVRYPDRPLNKLGYGLLGRGCLGSEQAEIVLNDNFVLICPEEARLGDRRVYRKPSTKEGVNGQIMFVEWIEEIEKETVTEVSSIWRDRGAICRHAPDAREWSGNIEYYRRNLPIFDDFEQIGGKTELAEAKIICLGDRHVNDLYFKHIIRFINTVAEDGDILLVEGLEARQGINKDIWYDIMVKKLESLFESQEEMASFRKDLPSLSKEVRIFGWDNEAAHRPSLMSVRKGYQLEDDMNDVNSTSEDLSRQRHKLRKEQTDYFSSRNKSMIETIDYMRQKFPHNRIFVFAGKRHFTEDSTVKEFLDEQLCIALSPIHERTVVEEGNKRVRKYYMGKHDKCVQLIQEQSPIITKRKELLQEQQKLVQRLEKDIKRPQDDKLVEQQKKLIQQGKEFIQLQEESIQRYNKLKNGNDIFNAEKYIIIDEWFKDIKADNNLFEQWNKLVQQGSTSLELEQMVKAFDEAIDLC